MHWLHWGSVQSSYLRFRTIVYTIQYILDQDHGVPEFGSVICFRVQISFEFLTPTLTLKIENWYRRKHDQQNVERRSDQLSGDAFG